MSTFAITGSSSDEVVTAVNYLLSNMGTGGSSGNSSAGGNVLTANTTNGQITSGGTIVSYLYRWMLVRYATSADGSTGFSTSPTNASYYGLYNSVTATPSDASNPTNYSWTQATGGFGTTKFLWYETYGGGQVSWAVSPSQPNASFAQVQNNTPVDLTFVTATSTLPVVTPFIYLQTGTTPSTPTGGTYNFSTLTLTPPSPWLASLPATSNSVPTYASQASFQAPPGGGSAGPSGPWTTPLVFVESGTQGANGITTYNYNVYQSSNVAPAVPTGGYYNFATSTGTPPSGWYNSPPGGNLTPVWATTAALSTNNPTANIAVSSWANTFQYTSSGGVPGSRGFIPMGYVLTPSSPLTATPATLSSWFGASRDNTTAPIGMGTPPIDLDTACFTEQGNTGANIVYSYTAATNTWTSVQGSVVNGNVFVTGSVNAAAMNANDIYALTMKGGTVTPGINSGTGFWLQANTGNAYMGGNLYIGNSATIGNNLIIGSGASIGSGLTVGSSATIGTNLIVGTNANIGSGLSVGTNANIAANLTVGNNAYIGGNLTIAGLLNGGTLANGVVSGNAIASGVLPPSVAGNTSSVSSLTLSSTADYDWGYTGGSLFGWWKTISKIAIPITSAMSTLGASNQAKYLLSFSATLVASGLPTAFGPPQMILFQNDNHWGGSNIPIFVPASGTPVYTGSNVTTGSISYIQNLGPTGITSFNGVYQLSATFPIPYLPGTLVAGDVLIFGFGVLIGNGSTGESLGTMAFTNIAWNVSLA